MKTINYKTNSYVTDGKIPYIRYRAFDCFDDLIAGFSTRLGGVSQNHLASMNLSFSRGDDPENVMENHRLFSRELGYDYKKLVFSDQVHDVLIHTVTKADAGKGIVCESDIKGMDGLVTKEKNIPIMTFYADCVPLFFYDPVKEVIALAHSGWKGTVNKIGTRMIERMETEFGCEAKHIICAIGPSICQKCYEVSEDVAEAFKNAYDKECHESLMYEKENGKYQLNLHQACYYNLIEAGVGKDNISMPDYCTCCNYDVLFSHRASNGMRGNLAAVMMLKEKV